MTTTTRTRDLSRLQKLVERHVKYFVTDWTEHDVPELTTAENGRYLWGLRVTGTWLFRVDGDGASNLCRSVIDGDATGRLLPNRWYVLTVTDEGVFPRAITVQQAQRKAGGRGAS